MTAPAQSPRACTSRARCPASASPPWSSTLAARARGLGAAGDGRGAVGRRAARPACRAFGALRRLRAAAPRLRRAARPGSGRASRARSPRSTSRSTPASPRPARSATATGRSWWWRARRPAGAGRLRAAIARRGRHRGLPHRRAAAGRHRGRAGGAARPGAGVAPYDERTLTGDLRHVVLRANHDGRVLAIWVTARPLPDGAGAGARVPRRAPGGDRRRRARQPRPRQRHLRDRRRDDRVLDGDADIDDRVDVGGRPSGSGCRAARSSRPTATSPGWPTRRSRARWPSARASASSTPTAASAASRSRSPAAARRR